MMPNRIRSVLRVVLRVIQLKPWGLVLKVLVLLYSIHPVSAQEIPGDPSTAGSMPEFVQGLWNAIPSDSNHSMVAVLFLRFTDLGCVPCLNNILDACDTIAWAMQVHGIKPIALVFMRDRQDRTDQERILNRWALVHNIHFPVLIASEDFFNANLLDYSTLVVLDREGEFMFFEKFPLPVEKLRAMMDLLLGQDRR